VSAKFFDGRGTGMANDKIITTAALIEKFKEALDNHWGYIWGTAGEMWTQARQEKLERTTDADRANSRKYGSKWIGHRVADCSGLFSWSFKQLGGYMYHGSDTMYRKYCVANGELRSGARTDGQGLKPGTAVFVWKEAKKKYTHVGLYVGNGKVIEAKGAQEGVTTSRITDSKWTHLGELKGVDYTGEQPAPVPAPSDDTGFPSVTPWRPTIRKGNVSSVVKEMQTMLDKLGYNLGICGIDGDYGKATEAAVKEFQRDHQLVVDGVCGPMTWDALQKAVNQIGEKPVEKVYSVTIRNLNKTQADAIVAIANNYPGAEIVKGE
jgi:hypothetical protein